MLKQKSGDEADDVIIQESFLRLSRQEDTHHESDDFFVDVINILITLKSPRVGEKMPRVCLKQYFNCHEDEDE
jgi:hypothetical protein